MGLLSRIAVLWPRSLRGQVLLAIALALFLAQGIGALLLYRAQHERLEGALVHSAAFRLAAAARGDEPPPPPDALRGRRRGPVERLDMSPLRPGEMRRAEDESELREARMIADIALEDKRKRFVGLNADNTRTLADAEAYRVGALMKTFEGVDTRVVQALAAAGMEPNQLIAHAFTAMADKAERIGQLNVSPDLLQALLHKPMAGG